MSAPRKVTIDGVEYAPVNVNAPGVSDLIAVLDEAVEAAARGIVASLPNDAEFEMHRTWATGYARVALETAAPFIAAQAWDEGMDDAWNNSETMQVSLQALRAMNPYREAT